MLALSSRECQRDARRTRSLHNSSRRRDAVYRITTSLDAPASSRMTPNVLVSDKRLKRTRARANADARTRRAGGRHTGGRREARAAAVPPKQLLRAGFDGKTPLSGSFHERFFSTPLRHSIDLGRCRNVSFRGETGKLSDGGFPSKPAIECRCFGSRLFALGSAQKPNDPNTFPMPIQLRFNVNLARFQRSSSVDQTPIQRRSNTSK